MKNKCFLLLIAIALAIISCSPDKDSNIIEDPTPTPSPQPTPNPSDPSDVTFSATLDAMSRATDTGFEVGDRIGVFAVRASEGDSRGFISNSGNAADNVSYQYNGNLFVPAATGIKQPSGYKYFYTAIYPYILNAGAIFDYSVKTDQSITGNYTASDLCTAYSMATDEATVALKFSHRLSRIIVNLSGDGWAGDDIKVWIPSAKYIAAVDVNALSFTANSNSADIYFAPNGNRSYKLILPPQTFQQGTPFISVSVNGKIYSLNAEATQNLVSGKSYEYTLSMNNPESDIVTFTSDINPWNTEDKIDDVLPEDLQDLIEPYITIYRGNNPPNIEGTVYVDPFLCVYCQDQGHGGFNPGDQVTSSYIRFYNQNMVYNTIDIDEKEGSNTSTGRGAFISGTGNNFSAFFNTVGTSSGISTKTALVISGTKTANGIANLKYAFVMVEKGNDPNHYLMDEGVFRVFEDGDGISFYTSWPSYAPKRMPQGTATLSIHNYIQ